MLIFIAIIVAFAGVLHGISGSGFPIISTLFISSVLPFKESIYILIFPTLAVNVFSCAIGKVNLLKISMKYWCLALSCLISSFFSVYLLTIINPNFFKILMSLAIIISIVMQLNGNKIKLKSTIFNSIVFGFIAGSIGGATNSISIILLIYLLNTEEDKFIIFTSANLCFFMGKIPQILLLYPHYQESITIMGTTLISIISIISVYVGFTLFKRVNVILFKRVTLLIMLSLSFAIGFSGIIGLFAS